MSIDLALSLLAFAAVIIGVFGQAKGGEKTRKTDRGIKRINVFGYAAIGAAFLVCAFSSVKIMRDARNREHDAEVQQDLREKLSVISEIVARHPIRPEEFEIGVLAQYHSRPDSPFPDVVGIEGSLGKTSYIGELKIGGEKNVPGGGRGSGYFGYRYSATKLRFIGPAEYSNFDSIAGRTFTVKFDPSKFHALSGTNLVPEFFVDLYIPGYLWKLHRDSDGLYEVVVIKENCILGTP